MLCLRFGVTDALRVIQCIAQQASQMYMVLMTFPVHVQHAIR